MASSSCSPSSLSSGLLKWTRETNFPKWYRQVLKSAELAENSVVPGCMIINPWGMGYGRGYKRK